jgi:hypothetical protein
MKDKRFEIIGEIDNIEIPDEVEQDPKTDSGFRLRVNKDNIKDFIESIKKNNGRPPKPSQKEMNQIMKETNITQQQLDAMLKEISEFFSSAVNPQFIQNLESMLSEKGNSLSQLEIDKEFDRLFNEVSNLDDEDIEIELDEDIIPDLTTHTYEILENDGDSYGAVLYERNTNLLSDFKAKYGDHERYDVEIFSPNIKVSNAIEGLSKLKYFDYVESNEKYILFRGIPIDDEYESFFIAVIQLEGEFEMVIPEYGNSFDVETTDAFSKIEHKHLFIDTPMGKILMQPANIDKIRTGLELVLFQNIKPTLSISDFGTVVPEFKEAEISSEFLYVGKILSNESRKALLFKHDFDLDLDQTEFNLFVKLKGQYSEETLTNIALYLNAIDFNTSTKIQTHELKCTQSKIIYISIDIDGLPRFIDTWIEE